MTASSADSESHGFFAYYRAYARSAIHGASAALMTGFGLLAAEVNSWFVVLAIAVYVLPPVFLYLTGEGERVPSVVGDDTTDSRTADADDEREPERGDSDTTETDRQSRDGSDLTGSGSTTGFPNAKSMADEHESGNRGTTDTDGADRPSSGAVGRESSTDATDTADEPGSATHEPVVSEVSTDDRDTVTRESAVEEISTDESESDIEPVWTETDTPTDESLLDVVATRDGAYAVGESGVVLASDGEEWSVALEQGPTTNSNPLRGVDATADGKTVWFAGDSGVLGRYEGGRLTDHSAPKDQTSTWEDVAVTGNSGEEWIHLVNGSGELLRGEFADGSVEWGDIEQPGSGSSISNIAFMDSDRGHLCDTNQYVYETTDGGESYGTIGIEDANAAFTGVAATDSTVVVAGDNGSVFRYDGAVWTQLHAGSALSAIDRTEETGLAAGDGGAVYELTDGSWESVETPVDADLHGIVIGQETDVAVGTDGTVIERQR